MIGNKIKTLAQMDGYIWNIDSMSLANKCAVEWSFEMYGDVSMKTFMVLGFVHYYALERVKNLMCGIDTAEQSFSSIDARKGLQARWTEHSWHRSYMDRCFATLETDGMIRATGATSKTDARLKRFVVTDKFVESVCDFYIAQCTHANAITASRRKQNLSAEAAVHREDVKALAASGSNTTLDYMRGAHTPHPIHKNRFLTMAARKIASLNAKS